jgi:hypothetical protein
MSHFISILINFYAFRSAVGTNLAKRMGASYLGECKILEIGKIFQKYC